MVDLKKEMKDAFGDLEKIEAIRGAFKPNELIETKYPKSAKRMFLIHEHFGMSIEEAYFWFKDMLADMGVGEFVKVVDTFTAAEQSSMFSSSQQRLGIQQDKVAGYLGIIGKMTKEMFQIVRDIKLLEEREVLYDKSEKGDDGAEKALKGVWIDFIDNGPGGIKASSVYGLAQQLGYTVLPDLFFSAKPNLKQEEVTNYVNTTFKEFNDKVRTVLVRKLELFVAWRDSTAKEIRAKKKFTIQYLRQHYNSIMLYVDWVKPYLTNVKRLGMDPEAQMSADIVGAFEGAVVDVELIARKPGKFAKDEPRPCVLATFRFRTRPVMQTGQDYSRGFAHLGRMEVTLRAYAWSDEDVDKFMKIKKLEDFEMLKSIDTSIEHSMDYLGDDIKKYLEGYGQGFGEKEQIEKLARILLDSKKSPTIEDARKRAEKIFEDKAEKGKVPSLFEPFTSIGKGFTDVAKGFVPGKNAAHEEKKRKEEMSAKRKSAAKAAMGIVERSYTFYKKARRLIVP